MNFVSKKDGLPGYLYIYCTNRRCTELAASFLFHTLSSKLPKKRRLAPSSLEDYKHECWACLPGINELTKKTHTNMFPLTYNKLLRKTQQGSGNNTNLVKDRMVVACYIPLAVGCFNISETKHKPTSNLPNQG